MSASRPRPGHAGRSLLLTASALLAGVLLAGACGGCGGSAMKPVVRVQGRPITQAQLAHWTAIKQAEARAASPAAPSSAGQLRDTALAFLVTAYWLEGEAAARGLVVSQAEVEANLRRLLSSPAGPALAAGLARRHMSQADELLVLRLDSLAQKLRAQIEAGGDAATRNARVRGFIAAYHQRWRQRTSCAPAYVIAQCRESPAGRAP